MDNINIEMLNSLMPKEMKKEDQLPKFIGTDLRKLVDTTFNCYRSLYICSVKQAEDSLDHGHCIAFLNDVLQRIFVRNDWQNKLTHFLRDSDVKQRFNPKLVKSFINKCIKEKDSINYFLTNVMSQDFMKEEAEEEKEMPVSKSKITKEVIETKEEKKGETIKEEVKKKETPSEKKIPEVKAVDKSKPIQKFLISQTGASIPFYQERGLDYEVLDVMTGTVGEGFPIILRTSSSTGPKTYLIGFYRVDQLDKQIQELERFLKDDARIYKMSTY